MSRPSSVRSSVGRWHPRTVGPWAPAGPPSRCRSARSPTSPASSSATTSGRARLADRDDGGPRARRRDPRCLGARRRARAPARPTHWPRQPRAGDPRRVPHRRQRVRARCRRGRRRWLEERSLGFPVGPPTNSRGWSPSCRRRWCSTSDAAVDSIIDPMRRLRAAGDRCGPRPSDVMGIGRRRHRRVAGGLQGGVGTASTTWSTPGVDRHRRTTDGPGRSGRRRQLERQRDRPGTGLPWEAPALRCDAEPSGDLSRLRRTSSSAIPQPEHHDRCRGDVGRAVEVRDVQDGRRRPRRPRPGDPTGPLDVRRRHRLRARHRRRTTSARFPRPCGRHRHASAPST
jgi:hypothetical protein